jgi:hypothetical protein
MHERARQVGAWVWAERRTFEVFGAWSATTPDPAAAVLFGEMSRRHGWHAELFFDRLPELASLDPTSLVAPAGPGSAALLDALAQGDPPDAPVTLRRLVAAYRVLLPMLVVQYRAARATVSEVAEPSLGRWLDIVLRDDLDEWCRGQDLLATVLTDRSSLASAAERQLELETIALDPPR